MEKGTNKKSLLKTILSILVLGVFIFMAVGSYELLDLIYTGGDYVKRKQVRDVNTKEYTLTEEYGYGKVTTIGKKDWEGRWHGKHTIIRESKKPKYYDYKEEVLMYEGKRLGKSKITNLSTGHVTYKCYKMGGHRVDCDKAAFINNEETSAYDVMTDKFPWFPLSIYVLGFEDDTLKAFLNTLEIVLNDFEFEIEDFDDYYSDAIDVLGETPYDSIIQANTLLSYLQGLEELKKVELRLAVFARYESDGNSTFDILKSTYPGYLSIFTGQGIDEPDVEDFCSDLDSCMDSYGELDLEDAFFADSVDTWMYRALSSILDLEEANSTEIEVKNHIKKSKKTNQSNINRTVFELFLQNSESVSVSEVLLYTIIIQFDQGDIIKKVVYESYQINNEIVRIPTIATEIADTTESSEFVLQGYVIDDGGSNITEKGIAWATHYNPTLDDNVLTTGSENFSATLSGLTEGNTYYARAYVTNSSDTVYGNCVSLVAMSVVGVDKESVYDIEIKIYPNPASGLTTFRFDPNVSTRSILKILDLKGQEVLSHDAGVLSTGTEIQLDLSGLKSGVYSCILLADGVMVNSKKLIINH